MSESIQLHVSGMKCSGCETNVTNKLMAIEGISMVVASSVKKVVEVEFDAEKTNLDTIKAAITAAGYTVM